MRYCMKNLPLTLVTRDEKASNVTLLPHSNKEETACIAFRAIFAHRCSSR